MLSKNFIVNRFVGPKRAGSQVPLATLLPLFSERLADGKPFVVSRLEKNRNKKSL
jgi:hypothetical protein